jgi:hypothetical protein
MTSLKNLRKRFGIVHLHVGVRVGGAVSPTLDNFFAGLRKLMRISTPPFWCQNLSQIDIRFSACRASPPENCAAISPDVLHTADSKHSLSIAEN